MSDLRFQQVVRAGLVRFRQLGGVRPAVWNWLHAVLACRTPVLGGHTWRCPRCDDEVDVWNGCKHRACPSCGALDRARWLQRAKDRLSLKCGYHHVTFTVPHELNPLWKYNRSWFAQQVLSASRETLLQVLGESRWLGALPGLLQTWQTWGRSLWVHLHTHVLVTAGGLTPDGRWKDLKYDYLAPTAVLRRVYRGKLRAKLLQGLSSGEMVLPPDWDAARVRSVLRGLYEKEWCVNVQPRYPHGEGVMIYLANYMRGGPLRESQLQALDSTHVRFSYHDHRSGRSSMRLPIEELLARLGEHVPEPGFVGIRYGGLYATRQRDKLAQARRCLGMRPEPDVSAPIDLRQYLDETGHGHVLYCKPCECAYVLVRKIDPVPPVGPLERGPPVMPQRQAA